MFSACDGEPCERSADSDKAQATACKECLTSRFHEWVCFSAHQATQKALKGLHQRLGSEASGHPIKRLRNKLLQPTTISGALPAAVRALDRFYITTRCPNGFGYGKLDDYYTETDSRQAIDCAKTIV